MTVPAMHACLHARACTQGHHLSPAGEYNLRLGVMKEMKPELIATYQGAWARSICALYTTRQSWANAGLVRNCNKAGSVASRGRGHELGLGYP